MHLLKIWKHWAHSLRKNVYALYLVARDPRVPVSAKIIIGLIVAYALSPIDLIPDFIPVIGYLDDMLLLPLGIWLAIKLVPQTAWEESRQMAEQHLQDMPPNYRAAAIIIVVWILALTIFILYLSKWFQ